MPPEFGVFTGVDQHESAAVVDQVQSPEEARLELEREIRRRELWRLIQEGLKGFDSGMLRPEHQVRQSGTAEWRRLPEEYDSRQSSEVWEGVEQFLAPYAKPPATDAELPTAA